MCSVSLVCHQVNYVSVVGRQVIVMLVMLLVVFAVCWLPFQIAILYAEHHDNKGQVIVCSFNIFSIETAAHNLDGTFPMPEAYVMTQMNEISDK